MTESGLNEFDSTTEQEYIDNLAPISTPLAGLVASNTTATLAPQPIQGIVAVGGPNDTGADLSAAGGTSEFVQNVNEQSELDKVEAAALNVVHNIEEKMEIISDVAIEGVKVAQAQKPIHVHLPAGGGSVIKNPG